PADLVLGRMVPGTARGVLVGDLAYTWLAVRLRQRTGRDDVTAMPFGIDTPTLFAMVFGVLGPAMAATGDPVLAWKVGMAATLAIGLAKVGLAFGGDWARRVVPRAALLGSIAGVAILLIAFLPTLKILRDPLVGLVALLVLLLGLFGCVRMPLGVPGAFAAVLAGTALFWLRAWLGRGGDAGPPVAVTLALAIPWPTLAWLDALEATLPYLSLALPFALVTIIGGIDNTESAAAAGDECRKRDILLTPAGATALAAPRRGRGGRADPNERASVRSRRLAGAPDGRGRADPPNAPGPGQRVHPDGRRVGLGARDDHRAALRRDRSRVGLRERGDALRRDPLARAERKPLLALGTALRRAGTPRGRLRCARRDLLARRDARPRARGRA